MRTRRCVDPIPPAEHKPGQRRIKQHSFECWGTDMRHMHDTGETREMWIWVCTNFVPARNDICGFEKIGRFVPLPMPPALSHDSASCTDPGCTEHLAQADGFWAVFQQEEARMGRLEPQS